MSWPALDADLLLRRSIVGARDYGSGVDSALCPERSVDLGRDSRRSSISKGRHLTIGAFDAMAPMAIEPANGDPVSSERAPSASSGCAEISDLIALPRPDGTCLALPRNAGPGRALPRIATVTFGVTWGLANSRKATYSEMIP
jgi:hypothetical protein